MGRCYDDFQIFLSDVIKDDIFIYLDPPYYDKGGELYQFSFTEEDHNRMSKFLRDLDKPWLLSYDFCDAIKELYSWAFISKINVKCTINTKTGSRNKPECLIMNKKYKKLIENIDLY